MKKLVFRLGALFFSFTFTFYANTRWQGQESLDAIDAQVSILINHIETLDAEKEMHLRLLEQAMNQIDELNDRIRDLEDHEGSAPEQKTVPMIVLEYNAALGNAYIPIQQTMDKIYIYKGSYQQRKQDIDHLVNPQAIHHNIQYATNIKKLLSTDSIYTVVYASPFTSTYSINTDANKNAALVSIPRFDVKDLGVNSLDKMFCYASSFNKDISNWNNPDGLSPLFYEGGSSIIVTGC